MTGEIVNLRRVRKAKARAASAAEAAGNRARFGRAASERTQTEAAASAASRHLDGHRLTPAERSICPRGDDQV
ncbi:MAG: DUF4169 family protein [Beijerinckiaceae bacterium]|nr:DUF4169 family protein [Beijerinckiaceae bacterium]